MLQLKFALPLFCLVANPASAHVSEDVDRLYAALRLSDIVAVMRDEGIEYGVDLEDELFAGSGGEAWRAEVEAIYDRERIERRVRDGLSSRLDQETVDELLSFFAAAPGSEIVDLEVEARRAMQDDDIEEAAETRAAEQRAEGSGRITRITDFIAANDLIEMNVAGAMNSNYAFYQGLSDGGAFDGSMTETQMIADVWAQEAEIRADTDEWIYGYLTLAYQPLPDADLDAYIAFSEGDAGQALNEALFAEFDAIYVDVSRRLGQRAALYMLGQDI